MRREDNKGDMHYECVVVYLHDSLIASKSPQLILDDLTNKNNFKLKGTGSISYYLGCDFTRDSNNDLCLAPRKCMDKMSHSYALIFSSKPKTTYHSPLENCDYPELYATNFLDTDVIQNTNL